MKDHRAREVLMELAGHSCAADNLQPDAHAVDEEAEYCKVRIWCEKCGKTVLELNLRNGEKFEGHVLAWDRTRLSVYYRNSKLTINRLRPAPHISGYDRLDVTPIDSSITEIQL